MRTPGTIADELAELLGHEVEAWREPYLADDAIIWYRFAPHMLFFGQRIWRELGGDPSVAKWPRSAVPIDGAGPPVHS